MMAEDGNIDAYQMIFGLNREEDERSLARFLQLFAADRLTSALIPRMSEREIDDLVATLSALMRNHLSEKEYHALFLNSPR